MTKEAWLKMTAPYREDPKKGHRLDLMNKIPTAIIFAAYPLLLLRLFLVCAGVLPAAESAVQAGSVMAYRELLLRSILAPLDGFIIVTVFRKLINRPRPYEAYGLPPAFPKETKGKSFPSRHVFSAMIIAVTVCFMPGSLWLGLILVVLASAIAVARILAGVHYVSDVAAGAAIGIIFGLCGFLIGR